MVTFWRQLLLMATVGTWKVLVSSEETSQLVPLQSTARAPWLGPRVIKLWWQLAALCSKDLSWEQRAMFVLWRQSVHLTILGLRATCAWSVGRVSYWRGGWSCVVTCPCLRVWRTVVRRGCCGKGWPGLLFLGRREPWGKLGRSWGQLFVCCLLNEETVVLRLSSWEDTLKTPLRKNCCTCLVIFSLWGF